MAVEEHIKGLITHKITTTDGYSNLQDKTTKNGVTWYKEDSYQAKNPLIEALLSTASKSFTGTTPGIPDFVIDTPFFYIVIEAKGIEATNNHKHSRFTNVSSYIKPDAKRNDEVYDTTLVKNRECAIDEALFYATFLNAEKDVIAIGASGTERDSDFRLTSFYLPKGENLSKIQLIEDGGLNNTFNSVENYKRIIYRLCGLEEKLYRDVYEDLRKYADAAAKFFNTNGVDENDRLGLVSAIVLALSNTESALYQKVSSNSTLEITPDEIKNALFSENSPYGVIILDNLPSEKRNILKVYFNGLLDHVNLVSKVKIKNGNEVHTKGFFDVNKGFVKTILSRTVYSLYKYIVKVYDLYKDSNIDVMGSFYSLFLQYAKADVKKGVVLTPKHITDLFCDLAEFYLDEKLSEKTKVLDICTGSGGFLIGALRRMDKNIDSNRGLRLDQQDEAKEKARTSCLIGVEKKEIMFVLAYANMRFHKDGKSSLYHGSSLVNDEDKLSGGKTFIELLSEHFDDESDLTPQEKILSCGPEVGMINPPYEEDVFEFIDSMLRYLKKGGIGICIVPINTQSINTEVTEKKNKILASNTLLASILMPTDLFNGVRGSGAATSTCILVFKAHIPHSSFLEHGGLTYLGDWSNDGFKMVPKHGRFEQNDMWSDPENGYKKKYLDDLKKQSGEADSISSANFLLDIHNPESIKSIRKPIHKFVGTEQRIKKDKKGNVIFKKNRVEKTNKDGSPKINKKGKPLYSYVVAIDDNGDPMPDFDEIEIFENEDWNIMDYVKTDYSQLTKDDFIKTLLDYSLYKYMKENNCLFEGVDDE